MPQGTGHVERGEADVRVVVRDNDAYGDDRQDFCISAREW